MLTPTQALDSEKEMSHAGRRACCPPTPGSSRQIRKEETEGGWALGDSVALITSRHPLLGFLASELTSDHYHRLSQTAWPLRLGWNQTCLCGMKM